MRQTTIGLLLEKTRALRLIVSSAALGDDLPVSLHQNVERPVRIEYSFTATRRTCAQWPVGAFVGAGAPLAGVVVPAGLVDEVELLAVVGVVVAMRRVVARQADALELEVSGGGGAFLWKCLDDFFGDEASARESAGERSEPRVQIDVASV